MVSPSLGLALVVILGSAAAAQERTPNSQVGASIAPVTEGISQTNGNGKVTGAPAWQMARVFDGGFTVGLRLGDGRGDATVRLYATQITNNTLREFTYQGGWGNTSNIDLPFYSEGAILVGDGRGKGAAHLYAGGFNTGDVNEFTWDGASWTSSALGTVGSQLVGAVLCDPRGDGRIHLYFSTGSSPPNNISYEFTYEETTWTSAAIPSPLPVALTDGTFGIATGDARNDGIHRLYQGVFDALAGTNYVYELSWNGTGWDALQVVNIGSGLPSQVMAIAVGDARNEKANRLYVLSRGLGLRELVYDGTAWTPTDNINVGSEVFDLVIGQGQNDFYNRVYIAQLSPSQVLEVTFDGAAWQTEVVATPVGGVFRVGVGDAHGDAVNRVYSSGRSGVFEFTHQ
jgi:hypothetical protein